LFFFSSQENNHKRKFDQNLFSNKKLRLSSEIFSNENLIDEELNHQTEKLISINEQKPIKLRKNSNEKLHKQSITPLIKSSYHYFASLNSLHSNLLFVFFALMEQNKY